MLRLAAISLMTAELRLTLIEESVMTHRQILKALVELELLA